MPSNEALDMPSKEPTDGPTDAPSNVPMDAALNIQQIHAPMDLPLALLAAAPFSPPGPGPSVLPFVQQR